MRVRDVMETGIVTIPLGTPYREVARILTAGDFSGAPVVDEAGSLIGVVSEKDLFRVLYPYYRSFYENPELYVDGEARESKMEDIADRPVEQFMVSAVLTADPEMSVMRAGAMMLAKGIHRMPVIFEGKLVGIVTRHNIYRELFKAKFD